LNFSHCLMIAFPFLRTLLSWIILTSIPSTRCPGLAFCCSCSSSGRKWAGTSKKLSGSLTLEPVVDELSSSLHPDSMSSSSFSSTRFTLFLFHARVCIILQDGIDLWLIGSRYFRPTHSDLFKQNSDGGPVLFVEIHARDLTFLGKYIRGSHSFCVLTQRSFRCV
jgi:hypothetical protein